MTKKYISSESFSKFIVPTMIILNLGITVTLASVLNVWIDEAFSLNTTWGGIGHAVRQALYFEQQPPLYFVLLCIWRVVNGSPFFARLFSVLCIALTIYVVSKLSKRVLGGIHPGWVTAAVAFNPFAIWAAVEIRMYALVLLMSSLLLLFFYDGYLCDPPNNRARRYYIVAAVFAVYTQYYLGFLLVANACALLVLGRWQALRKYLTAMLITGVCFAPLMQVVLHQVAGVTAPANNAVLPLFDGLREVYWNILRYLLPTGEVEWLSFARKWISRVGAILAVFLVVRGYRRLYVSRHIALWTIFVVLFIFFTTVSVTLGEELLKLRHTAVIFLPTILGVFSLIAVSKRKETLISVSLIMFLFYAITFSDIYTPMAKNGDWSRVATYIMSAEKPEEPILIFRNEFALPLRVYYKGKNEVVPIPQAPKLDRYDLRSEVLRNEREILNALLALSNRQGRIWVVTGSNEPFRGIDFHPEILESFVNNCCSVIESKVFYKSQVRLLLLRSSQTSQRDRQCTYGEQYPGLSLRTCHSTTAIS